MLMANSWLSMLTITQILGHDGIMLLTTVFSPKYHISAYSKNNN